MQDAFQLVTLGAYVGCLPQLQRPLERGRIGGTTADEMNDPSELQPSQRLLNRRAYPERAPDGVGHTGDLGLPGRRPESDGELSEPDHRPRMAGCVHRGAFLRDGIHNARALEGVLAGDGQPVVLVEVLERRLTEAFG